MQENNNKTINPIISIKNVTFTYLGEEEPAIKNINLEVDSGEFVLILGPSGSGKSSLVNLLNGTIPSIFEGDLEGEVVVDGKDTKNNPVMEMSKIVGQVFQNPEAQIVNVLVKDEIFFGPENLNLPREEIITNASDAISLVGIEDLLDRDIFQLSGGQMQKVGLASVLSMKPKILVLDQPTANIDPQSTREIFRLLGKLNKELGVTVLIIEHNVDELADLITKVVVMCNGEIVASDVPKNVFGKNFKTKSKELGLWTPQFAEISNELQDQIKFSTLPLTIEEAIHPIKDAMSNLPISHFELFSDELESEDVKDDAPIIEIKNLSFIYEVNNVKALSNINLSIHKGDFISIIGKNGSGKSTLAKILTKINKPPENTVFINGKDITKLNLFDVTKIVGYVFQNPDHQFVEETVFDEVAYSLRVRGMAEKEVVERVDNALKIFGLEKYTELSPFELSMGYRRLLSVATMLVVGQDVIILDEPTIGQDQVSCNLLMSYLDQLNKEGKTIIVITHDMRLISDWVGRAVIMSDSKILFNGSIYKVFQQKELLEKAAILVPPLVELTKALRIDFPKLSNRILTTEQFCSLFKKQPIE